MEIKECANGHLYDTEQYASCPYCQENGNRINFDQNNGIGKTVAVSEIGKTVAPSSYNPKKQESDESDVGKTVAVFQKKMNLEPVVGWLVCIDGTEKGKDYRIYAKNNTIGRSEKMDICIKGDTTISRENHARIAYDVKHNAFHLIPADSVNTIYLNDEPVYVPAKLKAYDTVEFGNCKFAFVPFCNDKFTWQNGLNQE